MTNEMLTAPWASNYVGREGLDCWALAQLVYREQYSIELPEYLKRQLAVEALEDDDDGTLAELGSAAWRAISVDEAQEGDLFLFHIADQAAHVGIALGLDESRRRVFLHARPVAGVVLDSLTDSGVFGAFWCQRLTAVFRHPDRSGAVEAENVRRVRAGKTILEMLREAGVADSDETHVTLDATELPRAWWGRVRPKGGHRVTVKVVPTGSGETTKNVYRALISLAITLVFMVVGAIIGGLLGPAGAVFGAGGGLTTGAIIGATIGGLLGGVAGSLVANPLIPPVESIA